MIRPQISAQLKAWAEPIIIAAVLAGLMLFMLNNQRVSGAFFGLVVLTCAGLAMWLANAIARARLRGSAGGAGIVLLDEGRIGHFGPDTGGFVDIDALSAVRVVGEKGGRYWELLHDDGPPMNIPTDARDADQLVDFLASLDGVTPLRVANALISDAPEVIWRRLH